MNHAQAEAFAAVHADGLAEVAAYLPKLSFSPVILLKTGAPD